MAILWLIILLGYGLVAGFAHIPPLMWALLAVFFLQDFYDVSRRRK